MNYENKFQERIDYQGDLGFLFEKICQDYKLGRFLSYKVVPMGYEDFNLILRTDRGKFFVKIFSKFRKTEECQRYVKVVKKVCAAGVQHPSLLKSAKGFLYKITLSKSLVNLFVGKYILGKTLFEENKELNVEEIKFVVKHAALINKIKIKPKFIYDSWSIVNLLKEYKKKGAYLKDTDKELISPLVKKFSKFPFKDLIYCFCHGDITKTNVMRDEQGKLYIIDFACANWYPRILELAVMLCELFFDKNDSEISIKKTLPFVLEEYGKYIKLTTFEKESLSLFILFGHAMHLLRANYEEVVNNNHTLENKHFLDCGRVGLQLPNT